MALLTNIIILLGVMCSIGTTLTLPGIAGIVLTVGMAVDANVLIFERIREESAKGKSLKGALAAGYSRAFGTIFDSHVTTLISSIILWTMGTGSIKGFGVALTIGVAASLFTALVVTRLIFDFLLERGWLKSIPMLHFIRATKPVAGVDAVLIPGDPEKKMRADRTRNGVPLPDDTWAAIVNTAREVGVSEASIQKAVS